ncbi:MAG: YegS/Rv2252/BmrU family lipid kinase [Lachnospiraceae bacterium]|nr:YegS/Rv2252/BmrU family lipid kinase [Lachnospiraceae bacterium]
MKNDPKILFVYNPRAGKERIRSNLLDMIDTLSMAGYEVTACPTRGIGHAVHAVLEREDIFEMVVCAGGDGTLDEVVCGMMGSDKKIPIGYIPAGTTNDFAVSLGIPSVMEKAAKIAVRGKNFRCDVGVMNQAYFVYTAAFGLFTEVSYKTKQDIKNMLGHAAYILEGIKQLTDVRSYHVKAVYKDGVIDEDCIFGMVTNSVSIGGFKEITGKNVKLNDGLFEVTLIKTPRNLIEMSAIVTGLLNRDLVTDMMYCFKTDHLIVDTGEEVAWTRDGEYGGAHTHVEIRNIREAITIRTPEYAEITLTEERSQ